MKTEMTWKAFLSAEAINRTLDNVEPKVNIELACAAAGLLSKQNWRNVMHMCDLPLPNSLVADQDAHSVLFVGAGRCPAREETQS